MGRKLKARPFQNSLSARVFIAEYSTKKFAVHVSFVWSVYKFTWIHIHLHYLTFDVK